MTIRIPAKTFLVGEYAVLTGDSAFVISHSPYFKFHLATNKYHPESPVGKLLSRLGVSKEVNVPIAEKNPILSSGGFGGSSAEFLAVWLSHYKPSLMDKSWWKTCLLEFQELNLQGKPSGADLVSQIIGGICLYSPKQKMAQKLAWVFKDLNFAIFKTGTKLKTHDHLEKINIKDLNGFSDSLSQVEMAFSKADSSSLIIGIHSYRKVLREQNLEVATTTLILQEVEKLKGVFAVKGCGALGADAFLVVASTQSFQECLSELKKKFQLVATDAELSRGVEWL